MKEILLTHKAERDDLLKGQYVSRQGLEQTTEHFQSDLIKVIVGPRRAGKSVFSVQMLKEVDFAYLNFDDERLIAVSDYDELLKAIRQVYGGTKTVLFDEIQNLDRWELFVNRLHRRGFNIVITGSNAHLLSRELSTHLTGRYVEIQMLPFSFYEFLKAKGFGLDERFELKERQGLLLNHLDAYLRGGGYPEVVVKGLEARTYLATLFESILFKDVVKRYGVRYSKKLEDLARYLVTNHSNEFSYSKLKSILEFRSVHTVENYVDYLREAFLIFPVDRFSHKLKEQMRSPRKAYAFDTGIIHAIKFEGARDYGRIMENLVAIELKRRKKEFYYYRSDSGKEVDFVIRKDLKVDQLVQVSYSVDDLTTRKRELSSLVKAGEELGCRNLVVLTWDHLAEEKHGGSKIAFIPLWRWLLGL